MRGSRQVDPGTQVFIQAMVVYGDHCILLAVEEIHRAVEEIRQTRDVGVESDVDIGLRIRG